MIFKPHFMLLSIRKYGLSIALLSLLAACSSNREITPRGSKLRHYVDNSNCLSQKTNYAELPFPKPLDSLKLDSCLWSNFSLNSLHAANAINLLGLLDEYVHLIDNINAQEDLTIRVRRLELASEILQKIDLASLEISSMASELDCEEERITQIADYLSNKEQDKETKLTVAAIVVGALGTVSSVSALIKDDASNVWEYVGAASGISELALGGLILWNKKSIKLSHERNALRDIWEEKKTSDIFPPAIWYYIQYASSPMGSLRSQILDRWLSFKQIDLEDSKNSKKLIALYFGNGGFYTTEQLYNRASMYDQLESGIKLIKQDLMILAIEFEKLNK